MNAGKKKVLLLAVSHPDAVGGQAACARMLVDHLDTVEWVSLSFPLARQYNFFFRFLFSVKILLHSFWICATGKVDAVHILTACARNALIEKLIIARVLKTTGVKVIINFQGAFDNYYSAFSSAVKKNVVSLLRKPDVVLCLHEDIKKFVIENGIVSAEKVRVIPNAVTIEPALDRSMHGDSVKILYLGWVLREKGIPVLVESAGILAGKFKQDKFSIDIVGPEGERGLVKELNAETRRQKTDHIVKFHPPVLGDEKRKYFADAGIFIFPSRMEGFPFVLLEAMQAGLAVVATDISPLNLLVEHGINGMLFEKDNAADLAEQVDALLRDSSARERLGLHARQHVVSGYSVEKIISMYKKLYAEI